MLKLSNRNGRFNIEFNGTEGQGTSQRAAALDLLYKFQMLGRVSDALRVESYLRQLEYRENF